MIAVMVSPVVLGGARGPTAIRLSTSLCLCCRSSFRDFVRLLFSLFSGDLSSSRPPVCAWVRAVVFSFCTYRLALGGLCAWR
jgi:hypothetical protein